MWHPFLEPMECEEAIYAEGYQDFIIEYSGREQELMEQYGQDGDCYQIISSRFAALYQEPDQVVQGQGNGVLTIPRCFGLLSSSETLEQVGVQRVRRLPSLELFGQGVLVGIIDSGDGVRM